MSSNNTFKYLFKQRCFHFSLRVIQLEDNKNGKLSNRIILNQLLRSATSIGANVVEGSNACSKKEFINFFQIALKSAAETVYWLTLFREINKNNNDIEILITECIELKKLLTRIILNTKNNSKV